MARNILFHMVFTELKDMFQPSLLSKLDLAIKIWRFYGTHLLICLSMTILRRGEK